VNFFETEYILLYQKNTIVISNIAFIEGNNECLLLLTCAVFCMLQCIRLFSAHWKMKPALMSNGSMRDTWGLQRSESFCLQT